MTKFSNLLGVFSSNQNESRTPNQPSVSEIHRNPVHRLVNGLVPTRVHYQTNNRIGSSKLAPHTRADIWTLSLPARFVFWTAYRDRCVTPPARQPTNHLSRWPVAVPVDTHQGSVESFGHQRVSSANIRLRAFQRQRQRNVLRFEFERTIIIYQMECDGKLL